MLKIRLSETIKKAPWFFTIEPYLRQHDNPVSSHPEAREPRIVPLVIMDYGSVRSRLKQMRYEGLKGYFIGILCGKCISAPRALETTPIRVKGHWTLKRGQNWKPTPKAWGSRRLDIPK
jgi:hypothetical protein